MNRILVTGATGKTGGYFLQHSMANPMQDVELTYLIRSKEKAEHLKAKYPTINIVVGSLDDKNFIHEQLSGGGYNTILHIAGIKKSLNLVREAVNTGSIKWLILVHTTGIYSKYKAAGEEYREIEGEIDRLLKGKDIALTILCPTMIFGTLNDRNVSVFMKMVYKLRFVPVVNHAKYELQPVWYGDLGIAYYDVLTHESATRNKNYNLSGGNPILLIDMLKIMGRKLGVKNHFVNIPFEVAYSGAWLIFVLSLGKVDIREKVQRLVEPRTFSHEDATRDFGYDPVDFETGINEEVELFVNSIKSKNKTLK